MRCAVWALVLLLPLVTGLGCSGKNTPTESAPPDTAAKGAHSTGSHAVRGNEALNPPGR